MLQKKFFLKNGTPILNYLKELNLVLYYKAYIRCDLLDSVFVLDDGYLLNHIKLSGLSKNTVGVSFLSTRVTYLHKNVSSFRLTSFLSYHVLSAKNVATLLVNNLKISTYRDETFGSKLFFTFSAVRGGFRGYSTGLRGFMPSSHYRRTMSHFISELISKIEFLTLTFFFYKGVLKISIGRSYDHGELPMNKSKYVFYSSYSFFRLGLLTFTSSMSCTRSFNNFSRSKARQGGRLNLNSVFLTYDPSYRRLEKKVRFLGILFERACTSLKVRKKIHLVFKDLISRRTKHEKIKSLIHEDTNVSPKFFVAGYSPLNKEKKLEKILFKYFRAWDIYQATKKNLDNLKKKIVTGPPKVAFDARAQKFVAKIKTSFFDTLLINKKVIHLDYLLTESIQKTYSCKPLTKTMIVRFALERFNFNFLKRMLIIKNKKNNVNKR